MVTFQHRGPKSNEMKGKQISQLYKIFYNADEHSDKHFEKVLALFLIILFVITSEQSTYVLWQG